MTQPFIFLNLRIGFLRRLSQSLEIKNKNCQDRAITAEANFYCESHGRLKS